MVKRNPSIEQICGNQTQPLTDTASQRNQTQPLSLLWRRWGHDDIITWSEHPLVICLSYDHKYLKAEMPLQRLLGYNGKSTMLRFHHNGQSKGKKQTITTLGFFISSPSHSFRLRGCMRGEADCPILASSESER